MSALKDVYDIIKDVKTLAKKHKDEEMAEKVVEIQDAFFDFREELENVKDENRLLKEKIRQFTDNAELENDLELSPRGYYTRKSEADQGKSNKYCAFCWQNHKKLMPLIRLSGVASQCGNCQAIIR